MSYHYTNSLSSDDEWSDVSDDEKHKNYSHKKLRRVKKKQRQKYRRRAKSFCKDLIEDIDGDTTVIKDNSVFPSWFRIS